MSKRKKNKAEIEKTEEIKTAESGVVSESGSSESGTKISVPKKKTSYFSKVDEEVLSEIEYGSPKSIKNALSSINKHKNTDEPLTEPEKVLVNLGCFIMNLCWPSENFSYDCPEVDVHNAYIGAIDFVEKGLFDSSTGNTDFLSSILPCLVLFRDDVSTEELLSQVEGALDKAAEYRQNSFLADYIRGVLCLKKGECEKAESILVKLYETEDAGDEVKCAYSQALYEVKKYEEAYAISSAILQKNPGSLNYLRMNARIAFEMKAFDLAEGYVARVLQQVPNNLEFLLFRAKILIEKKDEVHAASILDMYARMNDTNSEYLFLRGKLQLDWLKKTTDATETVEKGLALYPENTDLLLLAARIASVTDAPVAGRYADELVSRILEKDPQNQEALGYALDALIRRSLWQEAYEMSSRLVAEENVLPENILKHVQICLELGKTSEAAKLAASSYEKNASDDKLIQAYVLTQIATGNRNQSIALINSLLDSSSAELKSFLYYRRSLLQTSESVAMADLRNSLLAEPRNSDSLFRLYEIYYGKSDYKKAQYYLRQVVLANPNNVTYKNLNESLSKLVK